MQELSFVKNTFVPRDGQARLIEYLDLYCKKGDVLSVQWPTGYGKSIGFALAWKRCTEAEIANRLLMVVANDTQRAQMVNDFASDCGLVGASCPGGVWQFERTTRDLSAARNGDSKVFVCTVQQVFASFDKGHNTLADMLRSTGTSWMIGFDEFHHYGEDMAWGDAAKALMGYSSFTIAMSATPYRRGADHIFPEPVLSVSYSKAVAEGAVKPMVCHSYDYLVKVTMDDDKTVEYKTSELLDLPDEMDLNEWEERKQIRYHPEYINPIIINAVDRLAKKRAESEKRLQMIIRAMSCMHALAVCEQVRMLSMGMTVDWIGTGERGRKDKENDAVRAAFCPPKDDHGIRPEPSLDILVHVNMAGEGFDSINVCEIVDLFPVSAKALKGRATQDKQFYGRGARVIRGAESVKLHVNVPTDHPLSVWGGLELHAWMDATGDSVPKPEEGKKREKGPDEEWPPLPEMREIEFLGATTEQLDGFKKKLKTQAEIREYADELLNNVDWIRALYRKFHMEGARTQSIQAREKFVKSSLDELVGVLAGRQLRAKGSTDGRLIGHLKHAINSEIKAMFGDRESMTLERLEKAHEYVRRKYNAMGAA